MQFIAIGICALFVILGLVATVMSRRNWRIGQMVLFGFILVFSLVFFYLSARTLKTHENWETELLNFQASTSALERKISGDGKQPPGPADTEAPSNGGLKHDRDSNKLAVAEAMAERGRVWFGAIYERVNAATGELSAAFDQVPPAGLDPKSVVFVFEDKDKGKYLGEFTVTSVNQTKVKLVPTSTLTQEEYDVISKSRGPWVFYEVMPIDIHTLFAEQEPSVLKAIMPGASEATLAEFARDGKPAKYDPSKGSEEQPKGNDPADHVQVLVRFTKDWAPPDDPLAPKAAAAPAAAAPAGQAAVPGAAKPPEKTSFKAGDVVYFDPDTAKDLVEPKDKAQKVADFEKSDPKLPFLAYRRPLNDYAQMFREVYRRRNDLFALEAELKTQVDQIAAAAKLVQDDVKAATDEQAGLKKDLAKFKSEYDAVVAFNTALAAKQTEVNAKCSELFRANLKLNGQLADVEQKIIDAASRQPPAETSANLGR
jgi:hypothetical protein